MSNYVLTTLTDYSVEQMSLITSLEQRCKHFEGTHLRVGIENLRKNNGDHAFLCHDKDQLIGFLCWYTVDGIEGNINGMVHPDYRRQGVFRSLLERAKEDMKAQGIQTLRYRIPSDSQSGIDCVFHLKACFNSSEYTMELLDLTTKQQLYSDLFLRPSEPYDLEFMVKCSSQAFGDSEPWTREYFARTIEPHRFTYIALTNNEPVGMIRVNRLHVSTAVIHDFCVMPSHQGRGLGRDILVITVKQLLAEQCAHIRLGVVTNNKHALNLYQGVGFTIVSESQYYISPI